MMADDLVALIRKLDLERPFVCGYSDGGQIVLDLWGAIPHVARAVIIAGATYRWSPAYDDAAARWGLLGAQVDGGVEHGPFLDLVEHLREVMTPHFPERDETQWREYHANIASTWADPAPVHGCRPGRSRDADPALGRRSR